MAATLTICKTGQLDSNSSFTTDMAASNKHSKQFSFMDLPLGSMRQVFGILSSQQSNGNAGFFSPNLQIMSNTTTHHNS
jgi:hypothetical protein